MVEISYEQFQYYSQHYETVSISNNFKTRKRNKMKLKQLTIQYTTIVMLEGINHSESRICPAKTYTNPASIQASVRICKPSAHVTDMYFSMTALQRNALNEVLSSFAFNGDALFWPTAALHKCRSFACCRSWADKRQYKNINNQHGLDAAWPCRLLIVTAAGLRIHSVQCYCVVISFQCCDLFVV